MRKLILITCCLFLASCSDTQELDEKLVIDGDGRIFKVKFNFGINYILEEQDKTDLNEEAQFILENTK